MKAEDSHGVRQFLEDYPGMSLGPSRGNETIIKGQFAFFAHHLEGVDINEGYQLEIIVPTGFPKELPKVTETGEKIPHNGKYHVNPDGTLCLGSPLRLLIEISKKPNLVGFSELCLVPYLYAVSCKLKYGGDFAFNELAHGEQGIIDDYTDLLGVVNREQIIQAIIILGMKPRIANKKQCPCGCGQRLGVCSFRLKLNKYRKLAKRSWFRKHSKNIGSGM